MPLGRREPYHLAQQLLFQPGRAVVFLQAGLSAGSVKQEVDTVRQSIHAALQLQQGENLTLRQARSNCHNNSSARGSCHARSKQARSKPTNARLRVTAAARRERHAATAVRAPKQETDPEAGAKATVNARVSQPAQSSEEEAEAGTKWSASERLRATAPPGAKGAPRGASSHRETQLPRWRSERQCKRECHNVCARSS